MYNITPNSNLNINSHYNSNILLTYVIVELGKMFYKNIGYLKKK